MKVLNKQKIKYLSNNLLLLKLKYKIVNKKNMLKTNFFNLSYRFAVKQKNIYISNKILSNVGTVNQQTFGENICIISCEV